jgi:hypothetical protein
VRARTLCALVATAAAALRCAAGRLTVTAVLNLLTGPCASFMPTWPPDLRSVLEPGTSPQPHTNSGCDPCRLKLFVVPSIFHTDTDFVSYYGMLLQYLGAWWYVLGCACELACGHAACVAAIYYTLVITPYFLGGALFLAGAYLCAVEAAHSWTRAAAPPPLRAWRDAGRWVECLNVHGSILFFVGGALGYYYAGNAPFGAWAWINAVTFILGSVLSLIQSALLTAEWFFPQL